MSRTWWRVPCWGLAFLQAVAGVALVPERTVAGCTLLFLAFSLCVMLRLDERRGIALVVLGSLLGAVCWGLLGGLSTILDLELARSWAVATGFLVLPLRALVEVGVRRRRYSEGLRETLRMLLSVRLALVLIGMLTLAIWWWSQPSVRRVAWKRLGQEELSRQATGVQSLDVAEAQCFLALAADREWVEEMLVEIETWPLLACGRDVLHRHELSPGAVRADLDDWCAIGDLDAPELALYWLVFSRVCERIGGVDFDTGQVASVPGESLIDTYHMMIPPYTQGPEMPVVTRAIAFGLADHVVFLHRESQGAGGGPTRASITHESLGAFRLGHLPHLVHIDRGPGSWVVKCLLCEDVTGPAPDVSVQADGSLRWMDGSGREVVTPPASW